MHENRLVTIRVHGPLGEKYGLEHRFNIRTPREAIDALDANYPGFRRDFLAIERYALLADGDWRDDEASALLPVSREIDLHPIIEGRISGLIISGVAALIGPGIAATIIGTALTIGLLVGVSLLLTPKAKKPNADTEKDDSYMFSGPENVVEQGVPVPLVYGHCFVGSVVASFGAEVTELVTTGGVSALSEEVGALAIGRPVVEEPLDAANLQVRRPYVPVNA